MLCTTATLLTTTLQLLLLSSSNLVLPYNAQRVLPGLAGGWARLGLDDVPSCLHLNILLMSRLATATRRSPPRTCTVRSSQKGTSRHVQILFGDDC